MQKPTTRTHKYIFVYVIFFTLFFVGAVFGSKQTCSYDQWENMVKDLGCTMVYSDRNDLNDGAVAYMNESSGYVLFFECDSVDTAKELYETYYVKATTNDIDIRYEDLAMRNYVNKEWLDTLNQYHHLTRVDNYLIYAFSNSYAVSKGVRRVYGNTVYGRIWL